MNIYLKYKSILLLGFGGFFLPSDAAVWGGIFEFTHQKGETFFTLKPAVKWNEYLFFFFAHSVSYTFFWMGVVFYLRSLSQCSVKFFYVVHFFPFYLN